MKLSLSVIGHGAQQTVFDRHIPLWKSLQCPDVTILSPTDDPLVVDGWKVTRERRLGCCGHSCRDSVVRLIWLLALLSGQPEFSHHLICEYDSFSLSPVIRPQAGLTGIVINSWEPTRFIAPRYPNPPWLMDHQSALDLLRVAQRCPDVWEEGFADRYLAALAHLAGVPVLPYDPPGYTQGTIDPANAKHMAGMHKALSAGGRMLHGIKSPEVLAQALAASGQ